MIQNPARADGVAGVQMRPIGGHFPGDFQGLFGLAGHLQFAGQIILERRPIQRQAPFRDPATENAGRFLMLVRTVRSSPQASSNSAAFFGAARTAKL